MDTAPDGRSAGPAFWDLSVAQTPRDRLAAWLEVLSAALVLPGRLSPRHLALHLPDQTELAHPTGRLPSDAMRRVADEARRRARPALAGHLPGNAATAAGPTALAVPLPIPGAEPAILTLEAQVGDAEALTAAMTLLSLAVGWIPAALLDGRRSDTEGAETAAIASLRAVAAFIAHRRFSEAARSLMTHLSDRFGCDRVALGMARGARVRLAAISHAGTFSRALGLSRRIQAAMEEAFDQERVLLWPLPEGEAPDLIVERQAELAAGATDRAILSVPLFDGQAYRGVILFERSGGAGFSAAELARIEALCGLLTPILLEKRDNDRWLAIKAVVALRGLLEQAVGRSHLLVKAVGLAGLLTLGALFVLHGDRTVVAEAVVQGTEVRTVSAPFAGFIAEAPHREGDRIAQGDLLVRLDDREFTLELTRLTALRAQTELELDKVISERNRAEAGLVESRIRQIDAQIALAEQQIARSRIAAPFDGLVTSGDLSRSVGRSVEQGEPLLVIAPLTEFRVDLMVPEDSVDLIRAGQPATLKVTPLPERAFELTLRGTMPVARYENGQTRYLVEARFAAPPEVLVPGMSGAARIAIDRASLAQLWFGPLADRLRLWLWRNLAL